MKLRKPNTGGRALGAAMAATALMSGAGQALAEPVAIELEFTCPFPLIGDQPIRAEISADIPSQATVGEPTPEFTINALTVVNEDSRTASSWWARKPSRAPRPIRPPWLLRPAIST